MSTLVDGLSKTGALANGGKRVCVVAAPGDRRDEDIREIAQIVSKSFDVFVCREDDRKRGREHGAVSQLLKETLCAEGVSSDSVKMIPSEVDAVDTALSLCSPGDLLLIFADNITRSWKQIIYHHNATTQEKPEEEAPVVIDKEDLSMNGLPFEQDERGVFLPQDEEAD
jgi:cyanophycin synthetase